MSGLGIQELPYRIATLIDLRDDRGRRLLLHRRKHPNRDLYSPVGGKLEMGIGESPAACARREVLEETGLELPMERFTLLGMISEVAFNGEAHWLMFFYRVEGAVELAETEFDEGRLEWHADEDIDALPLPESDSKVIWPMVRKHEPNGFFTVHIDCTTPEMTWAVQQSRF